MLEESGNAWNLFNHLFFKERCLIIIIIKNIFIIKYIIYCICQLYSIIIILLAKYPKYICIPYIYSIRKVSKNNPRESAVIKYLSLDTA